MVREMPTIQLHRLVSAVGRADAEEVLAMAKPEQIRELLDLEIWQGDRVQWDEALDWLHFLTTLPDKVRARDMQALDVELLGYVLKSHLKIYLLEDEEWPEEPEGALYYTPDGWFALDIIAHDPAQAEQLAHLINSLYADDQEQARRLLHNLIVELPMELEEYSLRWRNGRLQDMGFVDPEEALIIYAYLDPASVQINENTTDQPLASDPETMGVTELVKLFPSENSFWHRAIAQIEEPRERERLARALMAVSNRNLSADRISPDDLAAANASLSGLHWRLSLGLEYLSEGDVVKAEAVLAKVALLRIARVGHSLTLRLRRRLLPALRQAELGHKPGTVDLLDSPLKESIAAMNTFKPQFYQVEAGQTRPFQSLADLATANNLIDRALAHVSLAKKLHVSTPLPAAVTYGDYFRTSVINKLLKREGPIDRPALQQFLRDYILPKTLPEIALLEALSSLSLSSGEQQVVQTWFSALKLHLEPLNPHELDLRFIEGLWLVAE
jgi:hypothetical protein